jgi:hypothetical protein
MTTPDQLPAIGTAITLGGDTFTVRRTEEVLAYGRRGFRVYYNFNDRPCYSPMSLTTWLSLAKSATKEAQK